MTAFATNLRRLMAEQRITRPMLAAACNVSTVTVGHWRAGRWEPKLAAVLRLARTLGTSVEKLAGA